MKQRSKFDELCSTFAGEYNTFIEYRQQCWQHLAFIIKGFSDYCEIPKESFQIVPPDKPDDENNYAVPQAAQFSNTDGLWHIGFVITLAETPRHVHPRLHLMIEIALGKRDGKVVAKYGWTDLPREIDLDDETQRRAFYDGIIERIKARLVKRPQDLIGKTSDTNPIGFKV